MTGDASTSADFTRRETWLGLLSTHSRPVAETSVSFIAQVSDSGSRPFLGITGDGRRFWVKYLGNQHGIDSLVSERVVAAMARKIDAPMRASVLVDVPEWLTSDGRLIGSGVQPGPAHGSEFLDNCIEKTVLDSVSRDGNRYRQPKFIALWELFLGVDEQWLYDHANDHQVWSFDHGCWTNGGEPQEMTAGDYERLLNTWGGWDGSVKGMDSQSFIDASDRLVALTVADFIDVVASVPVPWGIPDGLLECLAWWLHVRRFHVAERMRALAAQASSADKTRKRAR